MPDVSTLVSGIEYKMLKLIERLRVIQTENEQYKTSIREVEQINKEQTKQIKELENKLNILTTVKTLENKEGKVEAKAKINELLREIDKCIGLLNR
jgi:septal ring factor EnvC (AmiA/AmiB activator)